MHPAHILVADDDADVRRTIIRVLELAGHTCDGVGDAKAGMQALERRRYDLLVSDVRMPGNRKLELLAFAAASAPAMPVIVVSGDERVDTVVEALRLRAVDFLHKPFDGAQLTGCVDRVLALDGVETAPPDSARGSHGRRVERRTSPGVPALEHLSAREQDVVRALAGGSRVSEIGRALGISTNTVRNHLKSVFQKAGVHSQAELLSVVFGGKD